VFRWKELLSITEKVEDKAATFENAKPNVWSREGHPGWGYSNFRSIYLFPILLRLTYISHPDDLKQARNVIKAKFKKMRLFTDKVSLQIVRDAL